MDHKKIAERLNRVSILNSKSDVIYRWAGIILAVCFAILAILKSISMAFTEHWGIAKSIIVAVFIFVALYLMYKLCFWLARPILYAFIKGHKAWVKMNIELDEIDDSIFRKLKTEEINQDKTEGASEIDYEEMNISNREKNAQQRLAAFMNTVERERKVMTDRRQKEGKRKLDKILKYTRQTFSKFDFTDEELFQLCECVEIFVTERDVLSSPNIQILKKNILKQSDLKNFAWNIGNQYGLSADLIASFVLATFREWFANTELTTIRKTLRTTASKCQIEIDTNIIK